MLGQQWKGVTFSLPGELGPQLYGGIDVLGEMGSVGDAGEVTMQTWQQRPPWVAVTTAPWPVSLPLPKDKDIAAALLRAGAACGLGRCLGPALHLGFGLELLCVLGNSHTVMRG